MKTPVRRTRLYLDARSSARQSAMPDNAGSEIVAGYSFLPGSSQSETRSTGCNCPVVDILYAEIIVDAPQLAESKRIIEACIAAFKGKAVHYTGNAILAKFRGADAALRCAVMVRRELRSRNTDIDSVRQLRYRIGISACEVNADQSVNCVSAIDLSARMRGMAHTSGICVSQSVRERIREKSKIRFFSMGKGYLKNVFEPVEVFWIEIDGGDPGDFNLSGSLKVAAAAVSEQSAPRIGTAVALPGGLASCPGFNKFTRACWRRLRVASSLVFILGRLPRFTRKDA